jgi:branched-chain amino acid aminotransferase
MATRELASVDGQIGPVAEATVPLQDDGLYRGDGAFEVIRIYAGRPFALADHLDRIERSAATIELPVERSALEGEIEALLAELGDQEAQLRIVLTRGGRRIAVTEPVPPHSESLRVATVTYSPNVILNGVKSLSYGANMQATRIAKAQGADEALLVTPDGTILEGPTSTVFWANGGELRTTAIEAGVLRSITRDRLVAELDVSEGIWPLQDLLSADEAFLASTTREAQPIASIDGTDLPQCPGPRNQEAVDAFAEVLRRELGT